MHVKKLTALKITTNCIVICISSQKVGHHKQVAYASSNNQAKKIGPMLQCKTKAEKVSQVENKIVLRSNNPSKIGINN